MSVMVFFFFFFFQAEDGIRDRNVTGVQTCALPIFAQAVLDADRDGPPGDLATPSIGAQRERRSEERRVGKECRSRGSPEHEKKKKERERRERIRRRTAGQHG